MPPVSCIYRIMPLWQQIKVLRFTFILSKSLNIFICLNIVPKPSGFLYIISSDFYLHRYTTISNFGINESKFICYNLSFATSSWWRFLVWFCLESYNSLHLKYPAIMRAYVRLLLWVFVFFSDFCSRFQKPIAMVFIFLYCLRLKHIVLCNKYLRLNIKYIP